MKKLIIISTILLVSLAVNAQVYDGITQPMKYRFWTGANSNGTTFSFAGYKVAPNATPWLSLTGVTWYTWHNKQFSTMLWTNLNYKKQFWFLHRVGYNTFSKKFYQTYSGTWKAPNNFMVDFTWSNIWKQDAGWLDGDQLQFLAGYKYKSLIVLNAGYRVIGNGQEGFITNFRLMFNKGEDVTNWLQMKYDFTNRVFGLNVAFHFN